MASLTTGTIRAAGAGSLTSTRRTRGTLLRSVCWGRTRCPGNGSSDASRASAAGGKAQLLPPVVRYQEASAAYPEPRIKGEVPPRRGGSSRGHRSGGASPGWPR